MVSIFRKKAKQLDESNVTSARKNGEGTRFNRMKFRSKSKSGARDDEDNAEDENVNMQRDDHLVDDTEVEPSNNEHAEKESPDSSLIRRRKAAAAKENQGHAIVVYENFGEEARDTMTIKEYDAIPDPIESSDVVVKVKSSTISLTDCTIRRGMWHDTISLPNTPGFDLIGTILKMGDKARESGRFQDGDRVAALVRTGGNARYATVPVSSLVRVPGSVDSAEAACIVSYFVNAYQVLHRARPDAESVSLEGKTILITGGNGPTGQAIIQLAQIAGACKVYTTALEKYHDMLRQLGAKPLPLSSSSWLPEVKGKMDFVADGLCQDDYASPHAALKPDGHLVCMGMSAINNTEQRGWFGQPVSAKFATFKAKNFLSNTSVYDLWDSFQRKPEVYKRDLEYLLTLLEKEKIKPNLAGRVPLHDVPEAQKKIQEGKIRGMLVCKPWK